MAKELYEISTSRESASVSRAGYGVQLVLGASNAFSQRYKVYDTSGSTPLAALKADGFDETDPEYRAVLRAVSSSAKPRKVVVGQARNRPTQRWTLTPYGNPVEGAVYRVRVGNKEATFTAPASPTLTAVLAGLKSAIDALSVSGIVTTTNSVAVLVTGTSAGFFVPVVVLTRGTLTVEQSNPDPGVADDLAALLLDVQSANGAADWYAINLCFPSTATVLAAAEWTEANGRLLLVATNDTRCVRAPVVGNLDVASQLAAFQYMRTALLWHHDPNQFADAGWAGRCLPLSAGTETWVMKTVGGLEVSDLTGDERTQLQARRVSYYVAAHGKNLVLGQPGGQTFGPEYIDTVRGLDEVAARLGENWTAAHADVDKKRGFDDPGIQGGANIVESTLRGYESGRNDPRLFRQDTITVTAARADDVAQELADARVAPIQWSAQLANAVHKGLIKGTVR